jgi:flagellar protein FliS
MITGRNAYLGSMVTTASPARLLVLLYDRLVLDLQRAAEAQTLQDHAAAAPELMHAQEIVLELQSALRLDVWDGAAGLSAIYTWLHRELVRANVQRDVTATTACLDLVLPLADAWREAALVAAAV